MLIQSGSFYVIVDDDTLGHYVINQDGFLLQFHLETPYKNRAPKIFDPVCLSLEVKDAIVATFEINYLCLCLDKQKTLEVDTLLYYQSELVLNKAPFRLRRFQLLYIAASLVNHWPCLDRIIYVVAQYFHHYVNSAYQSSNGSRQP